MNYKSIKSGVACAVALFSMVGCSGSANVPTAEEIMEVSQRVADWQIENFEDQAKFRAPWNGKANRNQKKYHDLMWQNAAFYKGLFDFSMIAPDSKYVNWLNQMGQDNKFKLHTRPYHADDHAVGQLYLNLYDYYDKAQLYMPTKRHFDMIMESKEANKWHWNWCDALFMAPPVWTHVAKATGNIKYLEYMDSQYKKCYDKLYDKDEKLFFRDLKFVKKREENGQKLFWSRGNGWVFGGLAAMIPNMPEDWKGRDFYTSLFKEMAVRVKELQREDGTWSAGLLGSVESYPNIETSGSSFFVYGLAWGISNGLLDKKEYEPTLLKGWAAVSAAVNEKGMLTYVQGVGSAPQGSSAEYTEVYGSGAFLAAGAEMYRYVNKFYTPKVELVRTDAKPEEIFMTNGGWCWYQGPRAIISKGKLVMGGLDGQNGDVNLGVYDLKSGKVDGQITLHSNFQKDDHDAPALYARPDGSILAMWAKHGQEKKHHYKISQTDNYLSWSEPKAKVYTYKHKAGVTYMNIYYMEDEGSLYNFFRDGPHFNPAFITSKDHGLTWSDETHMIANEVAGRNRPYTMYSQVDPNTVGIVYTDAHPRGYGNSLYYVELRDKKFYSADGKQVWDLKDGPLPTTHGEKIYKGSETKSKPSTCESVPNSAWNCAMVSDTKGNPHIGYTLYWTNDDHRFRLATWDGTRWIDREIAYAGRCLYYWESSYTGLMAIDPTDPEMVYISTDVDPKTGKYLGGKHEIYSARITAKDNIKTIKWTALTSGSKYRNIRPIIVANEGYKVLLWLNGPWDTYVSYDSTVRGRVLERP